MKTLIKAVMKMAGLEIHRITPDKVDPISQFLQGGSVPWTKGYQKAKFSFIKENLNDTELLETFRIGGELPEKFGFGFDERCVEYPWVISQLNDEPETVLDAGSTLNHEIIINQLLQRKKNLDILTLAPEGNCFWKKRISYIYSDLREIPMRENYYDLIVCISTLEHIGCDNKSYTIFESDREQRLDDFTEAMKEFRRTLKPGGRLFLTVPFGEYHNHVTFQQFDRDLLSRAVQAFGETKINEERFFRYTKDGWEVSDAEGCADAHYADWIAAMWETGGNIPNPIPAEPDRAAGARAVACVKLVKY